MSTSSKNGQFIPGDGGRISFPSLGENEKFGAHSSNTQHGVDTKTIPPATKGKLTLPDKTTSKKTSEDITVLLPSADTSRPVGMRYQDKAAAALARTTQAQLSSSSNSDIEAAKQKALVEIKRAQQKAFDEIVAVRNNISLDNPEAIVEEIARNAGLNYASLDHLGSGRKQSS